MRKNKENDENKIENLTNNLMVQVEKLRDHCNEKSYKTRYRYSEAVQRLCEFLASKFRLQKFQNLKSTHIIAYVQYMKDNNISAATIKTDLAGIRFYHRLSGSKNILIDNSKLDLQKRHIGEKDRAWTSIEIENSLALSKEMGRLDIHFAIKLSSLFGFRLEEVCRCTVNHIKYALDDYELYIKGKGGQERFVPVLTLEQRAVLEEVLQYALNQGKTKTDKILSEKIRGGTLSAKRKIQNWIANHRQKFQEEFRKSDFAENKKNGKKQKAERLTYHGLRYYFAQQRFSELDNDPDSKKRISESLGHHRGSITDIYLSESKKKKRKQ